MKGRVPSRVVACTLGICGFTSAAPGQPVLERPDLFRIELFADFGSLGASAGDAFQLTISPGEGGFAPGLFVTPGPLTGPRGNSLYRIDAAGGIHTVTSGLEGAESMVFARGAYGSGILVSEPRSQRVRRVMPDGTVVPFASVITPGPFGPPVIAYGDDGRLYGSGGSFGDDRTVNPHLYRIDFDGSSAIAATIPASLIPPPVASTVGHRMKGASSASLLAGQWQRGGGWLLSTFSTDSAGPSELDVLISLAPDGTAMRLAEGLSGIQLLELGPGADFGANLFLSTRGGAAFADGAVYTLSPSGLLSPFLSNIDAVHVAFDTEGVLGGGMFVADETNQAGAGKVWRITVIPATSSATVLGAFGAIQSIRRRRAGG